MTVEINDIKAAYALFLGREPRSDEVAAWRQVGSVAELRRIFLACDEFRATISHGKAESRSPRLPLDLPPLSIEWQGRDDVLEGLLAYVTQTWTRLGEAEPHWSVLSSDQFRSENISEHEEAFFASGAFDAGRVKALLERHERSPSEFARVVEYGCGVGRVTPFFAKLFKHVTAIDISTSHLALARAAIEKSGDANVDFMLARAPHFGMDDRFDLWFSRIVLQHNPPPVIALILTRMFSTLAQGGIAIFQVPTYAPGYRFDTETYLAAPKPETIEMHCLPQEAVFRLADEAGCVALELREDEDMGYPFLSNTFVFLKR